MFILTPIPWHQVHSVDPCRYQHVGYGMGDIVSLLHPCSSWQCHAYQSCSAVLPTPSTTGNRPFYVVYTFSIVADTYSSLAAKAAMGRACQFDMSTSPHPNGKYIPRISVS